MNPESSPGRSTKAPGKKASKKVSKKRTKKPQAPANPAEEPDAAKAAAAASAETLGHRHAPDVKVIPEATIKGPESGQLAEIKAEATADALSRGAVPVELVESMVNSGQVDVTRSFLQDAIESAKKEKADAKRAGDAGKVWMVRCNTCNGPGIFIIRNPSHGPIRGPEWFSIYKPLGVAWPDAPVHCQCCLEATGRKTELRITLRGNGRFSPYSRFVEVYKDSARLIEKLGLGEEVVS